MSARDWREMTLHKDWVHPDDNIKVNGEWTTLCENDFTHCPFMGRSIRGDSYPRVTIRRIVSKLALRTEE